ncbi:MAG: hypothetical protein H6730_05495 [Deltaproteobacteria bacterium]|nr:hypothetical protein [Deltaproteobacteria bacterium]
MPGRTKPAGVMMRTWVTNSVLGAGWQAPPTQTSPGFGQSASLRHTAGTQTSATHSKPAGQLIAVQAWVGTQKPSWQ